MRRFLLVLLILVAATTFVVGQEFGPTWIDSENLENELFPTSYLAYVSSGAFTDEIDVILRSPLSMGFYEGYGIFTLYGNFSTVWGVADNNPFTTTNPETDIYQLGATMPVGDGMRAGFVTRYVSVRDDRIDGGLRSIEGSETTETYEQADPNIGRVNITEVETYAYEFGDTIRSPIVGAGLTMGSLGVSLFGYSSGTDRTIGATYEYSYTPHADFDPNALETTAISVVVGADDEGKAASYPADSQWGLTALGQLPLELFGSDSPVTAYLGLTGETNGLALNNVRTAFSATGTDYTDPEDAQTTVTATYGETLGGTWDPENDIAPPVVVFGTSAAAVNPYQDLAGTADRTFGFDLGGGVDPVMPLAERITLNAKAHLGLGMGFGSDDEALAASVTATDPDQSWESTFSSTTSDSSFAFDITSDLGGRVEFRDTAQVVTLSSGLFLQPGFARSSVTPDTSTEVLMRTSTGDALGTLAAGSLDGQTAAAAAAAINAGTAGTSTLTTTETYDGSLTTSTFTFDMVIPTSVRVNLFEGAVSLVGGYNIRHGHTFTTTRDDTLASIRESAVVSSDGVEIYNETGQPLSEVVATNTVERTTSTTPWAGQMGWMVRWQPTESLTIDLEGQSVMNALNFDIFGGGGFNPSNLLGALNISMSFRY